MEIIRKVFGELDNNCYIIYDNDTNQAYIIDPGYEAEKIADIITRRRLNLKGILATHFHYDHTDACEQLRELLHTKVYMNRRDAKRYKGTTDGYLRDGDILTLGDEEIRVIETPGHTSGGICLLCEKSKQIFTGDTLFPTHTGYVVFETGSPHDMEMSVKRLDSLLDDDYMIWPGHEDNADMRFVRKHNEDFKGYVKGVHPAHAYMNPDDLK